jgi:hypothetical protein
MEYHQKDDRWELFGITEFDTYCQSLVVKGLFHSKVPIDVPESFVLCEYMMAHAWYHYPLYDEALSKLLRIIEMAVKFRCKELNISLDSIQINRRTGRPYPKRFADLINDIDQNEPAKKLKEALDRFRSLRNLFMHPEQHSYSGAAGKKAIIFGVNILNILFLPEDTFLEIENEAKRIKDFGSYVNNDLYVMNHNHERILIEDINIMGAMPHENGWQYLLIANPVLDLPESEEFTYPVPIIADVHSIEFRDQNLIMTVTETNNTISFEKTEHPDNLAKHQVFLNRKETIDETNRLMYEDVLASEIDKRKDEFWHKWLWKLKFD